MIFIPCKVVLVVDILDDEVGGDKGDGDDDIMAMRMMGVIWVMMMMGHDDIDGVTLQSCPCS